MCWSSFTLADRANVPQQAIVDLILAGKLKAAYVQDDWWIDSAEVDRWLHPHGCPCHRPDAVPSPQAA
jgi:hypothetical protein